MNSETKITAIRRSGIEGTVGTPSQSLAERIRESSFVSYWQDEWKPLAIISAVFLMCYYSAAQ